MFFSHSLTTEENCDKLSICYLVTKGEPAFTHKALPVAESDVGEEGGRMTNSDKDLILTWANYNQKLSQAFRRYLDSQLFCNVTLSAEGRTVKCHQEILSACSNWFENILSSVESYQHPIILLKDVSFIELEYIVNFMYSGEVVVPQEEIQSFLKTAELLEIKGLLDRQEEKKVTKQPSSSPRPKESPVCFNNGELTVTTKKVEKEEICSQINSLVIYNQINNHMQNLKPPPRSNPLVRAYEANKRKSESSSSNHEAKKSSRSYEPNVPVFDNRHIYASDLVQSHFDPPGIICPPCILHPSFLLLFTFTHHLHFPLSIFIFCLHSQGTQKRALKTLLLPLERKTAARSRRFGATATSATTSARRSSASSASADSPSSRSSTWTVT